MSYVLSGKLAGMGDASGVYASLMVAYQNDHEAWLKEKAAYDRAVQGYAAQSAGASSSYAAAMAAYNAQNAARAAALVAVNQQNAAKAKANSAAVAQGVVLPAGYPGCISQAQHNAWQADCARLSATVKGLGADPAGSPCALALLAVCPPPISVPPSLGPPPVKPAMPPPPPLRPEPRPPTPPPASVPPQSTGPFSVPTPAPSIPTASSIPQASTPATVPASTKSAGLVKNGLILVVIAGGSYALYRTFKKPKAS
jgi:hypothetical protein